MEERLYRLTCDRCGEHSEWHNSPVSYFQYPRIGWKRVGNMNGREGGWDYCPECAKDVIESTAWLIGADSWWVGTHEIVSGKAIYHSADCSARTGRVLLRRINPGGKASHVVVRRVDADFKVHLRRVSSG